MADDDELSLDKTETGILQQLGFLRPRTTQRAWFVGTSGTHSVGKLFPLSDGMTIGRAPECDIVLEENGVSRLHARVHMLPGGRPRVTDAQSKNGIQLDGVTAKVHTLRHGQRLQIGDVGLMLARLDDAAEMIQRNLIASMERAHRRLAPDDANRSWLLGIAGTHSVGKLVPIEDGMTLGRSEDADLVVEENGVSRVHARLTVTERGIRINDLHSSNGIRVDGVRAEFHDLRCGQRFRVGDATLAVFRLNGSIGLIRGNVHDSLGRIARVLGGGNAAQK
ncbi:MAG TPA: FHA domain-containing protein [Labilithrix sp.]|jgi:pSer/pThr/pTyr-binding forkhead associated (FHA) protein|nr:FHA domain-containing protein [Labilithrix sp.]